MDNQIIFCLLYFLLYKLRKGHGKRATGILYFIGVFDNLILFWLRIFYVVSVLFPIIQIKKGSRKECNWNFVGFCVFDNFYQKWLMSCLLYFLLYKLRKGHGKRVTEVFFYFFVFLTIFSKNDSCFACFISYYTN